MVQPYQELIEPAKPAREHVTSAYRSINGEIQTWRPYAKSSITCIWSFGHRRVLSHMTGRKRTPGKEPAVAKEA